MLFPYKKKLRGKRKKKWKVEDGWDERKGEIRSREEIVASLIKGKWFSIFEELFSTLRKIVFHSLTNKQKKMGKDNRRREKMFFPQNKRSLKELISKGNKNRRRENSRMHL